MDDFREPSYYCVIPYYIMTDDQLSSSAKLLFGVISSLQVARGYCYAKNQYLADIMGLKIGTISGIIGDLEKAGHIRTELVRDEKTNQILERRISTNFLVPTHPIKIADISEKNRIPSPGNIEDPLPEKSKENNIIQESKLDIPPKAPQGGQPRKGRREPKAAPDWKPERFAGFWAFYPRGENKQGAIRAWDKLHPSDDLIDKMAAVLNAQKQTKAWKQGIGVPYASTWLNQQRWTDEISRLPDGGNNSPTEWAEDREVL